MAENMKRPIVISEQVTCPPQPDYELIVSRVKLSSSISFGCLFLLLVPMIILELATSYDLSDPFAAQFESCEVFKEQCNKAEEVLSVKGVSRIDCERMRFKLGLSKDDELDCTDEALKDLRDQSKLSHYQMADSIKKGKRRGLLMCFAALSVPVCGYVGAKEGNGCFTCMGAVGSIGLACCLWFIAAIVGLMAAAAPSATDSVSWMLPCVLTLASVMVFPLVVAAFFGVKLYGLQGSPQVQIAPPAFETGIASPQDHNMLQW